MTHKDYNGWTNYETWLVKLWMDNEQGSSDYWQEVAADMLPEPDTSDVADLIKEQHEESLPKLEGFAADLMNAALSEVNWYEIAEHIISDAKENAEYIKENAE